MGKNKHYALVSSRPLQTHKVSQTRVVVAQTREREREREREAHKRLYVEYVRMVCLSNEGSPLLVSCVRKHFPALFPFPPFFSLFFFFENLRP